MNSRTIVIVAALIATVLSVIAILLWAFTQHAAASTCHMWISVTHGWNWATAYAHQTCGKYYRVFGQFRTATGGVLRFGPWHHLNGTHSTVWYNGDHILDGGWQHGTVYHWTF